MRRSTNQKILLVFSVIEIVFAVFGMLFALLSFAGGAILGGSSGASEVVINGVAVSAPEIGGLVMMLGVLLLVGGAIDLITGILGVRAANDSTKIKPVWALAVVQVIIAVVGIVFTVANGAGSSDFASCVVSLALAVAMLIVANSIKNEPPRILIG